MMIPMPGRGFDSTVKFALKTTKNLSGPLFLDYASGRKTITNIGTMAYGTPGNGNYFYPISANFGTRVGQLSMAASSDFDITAAWTANFVFYPTSLSYNTYSKFLWNQNNTFFIHFDDQGNGIRLGTPAGGGYTWNTTPTVNAWNTLEMGYDGSSKIYVILNGTLLNAGGTTVSMGVNPNTTCYIGLGTVASQNFEGYMQQVIWRKGVCAHTVSYAKPVAPMGGF
jgi:hypothetical protein